MSKISIIGSGGMAAAIGGLAIQAGHSVELASREPAKAQALARQLGLGARTASFSTPPSGDIVILAVPYSAVLDVVHQYARALASKVLVDITNPVGADLRTLVTPKDSFGALEIAKAVPATAAVIKAFNTQFSHVLADGAIDGRTLDIFLAGDDALAKASVSAFVDSLGLRSMDVGQLSMARALEHVCLLSLGLMAHALKHTDFAIGVSVDR